MPGDASGARARYHGPRSATVARAADAPPLVDATLDVLATAASCMGTCSALVCFVAGTFVSPPYPGPPGRHRSKKKPSIAPNSVKCLVQNPLRHHLLLPARRCHDRRHLPPGTRPSTGCTAACPQSVAAARTEPLREADRPAQSFSSRMARSAPPAAPAEVEVILSLPSALYEQLAQEAARQNVPLSTLLRQIIETHTRGSNTTACGVGHGTYSNVSWFMT